MSSINQETLEAINAAFVEYDAAGEMIRQAQANLELAKKARSDAALQVAIAAGDHKKFTRNGKQITVVARDGKVFLRSPSSNKEAVIDLD